MGHEVIDQSKKTLWKDEKNETEKLGHRHCMLDSFFTGDLPHSERLWGL